MRVQITSGLTQPNGEFSVIAKIFDEQSEDGTTPVDLLVDVLAVLDRVDYSEKSGRIVKVAKQLHEYESMTVHTAKNLEDCLNITESFEGVLGALSQPVDLESILYAADFLDLSEQALVDSEDKEVKLTYVITRLHLAEPQSK
jgi:hypothetical protein